MGTIRTAADWGPPGLSFSVGTFPVERRNSSFNRNRTDAFSGSMLSIAASTISPLAAIFASRNTTTFSSRIRAARFTFTGAATAGLREAAASGSDLADFLIGVPDASAIAFGNADKYFREPVYDVYFNDDWRVMPILTINAGMRWDYGAPITELFGRPGESGCEQRLYRRGAGAGQRSGGPVTGGHYPASLIRPDRRIIEPRIGITWRPIPASTVVIRAGYGIYPDTSVYQNIVLQHGAAGAALKEPECAEQRGLPADAGQWIRAVLFGYQRYLWHRSQLPHRLRAALAVVGAARSAVRAADDGDLHAASKARMGRRRFCPTAIRSATANPCPSCPSGFVYETSNGNSIREAGQMQLRRRLRSGFAATLAYTFSKSIDDDAYLGGAGHSTASSGTAQSASLSIRPRPSRRTGSIRGPSARFRASISANCSNLQAQYTSGQGLEGGTLLGGWRGRALKEWTVLGNLTFGTGLPETPLIQRRFRALDSPISSGPI